MIEGVALRHPHLRSGGQPYARNDRAKTGMYLSDYLRFAEKLKRPIKFIIEQWPDMIIQATAQFLLQRPVCAKTLAAVLTSEDIGSLAEQSGFKSFNSSPELSSIISRIFSTTLTTEAPTLQLTVKQLGSKSFTAKIKAFRAQC